METRVCAKCGLEKGIDEYHLHSNRKPRRDCKDCFNVRVRTWQKENPAAVRAAKKAWRMSHPEVMKAESKIRAATLKARRASDPEGERAADRVRRAKAPEPVKRRRSARAQEWRGENVEHCRKYQQRSHWLRLYGLAHDDFDFMLSSQGGLCASCGNPPIDKAGRLCVDHDHATGQVRGLLCRQCNTALGMLFDDPVRILALAAYLKKSKALKLVKQGSD